MPRALLDLVSRNRRRYGGYVVHLAIVILVVGVTASSAYSTVRESPPAQSASPCVDRRLYAQEHGRLPAARAPTTRSSTCAWPSRAAGRRTASSSRASAIYDTGQIGNEVDIRSSLPSGTDLYSILQGVDRDSSGGVSVKVLVNPAVGLVWLAGVVFLLGALITLWPDPREARQLARRYGELLARSGA